MDISGRQIAIRLTAEGASMLFSGTDSHWMIGGELKGESAPVGCWVRVTHMGRWGEKLTALPPEAPVVECLIRWDFVIMAALVPAGTSMGTSFGFKLPLPSKTEGEAV
jgi:hypothetical protein